jgi:hypothetical protein
MLQNDAARPFVIGIWRDQHQSRIRIEGRSCEQLKAPLTEQAIQNVEISIICQVRYSN